MNTTKTEAKKLLGGMVFRTLGTFGNEPGPWHRAIKVQTARAGGRLIITVAAPEDRVAMGLAEGTPKLGEINIHKTMPVEVRS